MDEHLVLRLRDSVSLAVPPRLDSLTTYVLLEQEAWFEKEIIFLRHWLKPGMTAIDIGANLGVYALPLASLVGDRGPVFAYEPASAPRRLLEISRDLNGASNLKIIAAALSDSERTDWLSFGASSELNVLGRQGDGETVLVTSLDVEDARRNWRPDFVKIDAEGEEEKIVAGGLKFFAKHSPLVMFEVKAGDTANDRLRITFHDIGYGLYRSLPSEPVLVPIGKEPLDPYELNLFAAKPDRAQALAASGMLVDRTKDWTPDATDPVDLLRQQQFAPLFSVLFESQTTGNYAAALSAYAAWRDSSRPIGERYAAVVSVCRLLDGMARQGTPSLALLSTLARASYEAGNRATAVNALRQAITLLGRGPFRATQLCWPASPRHDSIDPGSDPAVWFGSSIAEQTVRLESFSSRFGSNPQMIAWLCGLKDTPLEFERRLALLAAISGKNPSVPPRLRREAADHLNASTWREGKVPGTNADV